MQSRRSVLAELAANGYGALTIDALAIRARVSKASLCRRWLDKRDLVLAAVQAVLPDPDELTDTGTLRGDLLAFFTDTAAHLQGPRGQPCGTFWVTFSATPPVRLSCTAPPTAVEAPISSAPSCSGLRRHEVPSSRLAEVTVRQLEAGHAILRHHYLWEGRLDDQLCSQIVDEVVLPLLAGSSQGPHQPNAPPGYPT